MPRGIVIQSLGKHVPGSMHAKAEGGGGARNFDPDSEWWNTVHPDEGVVIMGPPLSNAPPFIEESTYTDPLTGYAYATWNEVERKDANGKPLKHFNLASNQLVRYSRDINSGSKGNTIS